MVRFNLPDITFVEKSPEKIEADIVNRFEQSTGIRLSQADPRRKFIQTIVPLLAQQRTLIDYSAKQNLLGYAAGEYLDHIGANSATDRLQSTHAKTTIRFHFSVSQAQIIPIGTRATAGDNVFFSSLDEVTVTAGSTSVDIEFECTEAGAIGNDYLPGEINQLVDPIKWVQSIENITKSEGGADIEDDDAYADRIRQSPESFSTAGPDGAYEYWARSASPLIIEVVVHSPSPGVVEIRPLLQNGELPGQEILDLVFDTCNDRKVRPLTDQVQVLAPEPVSYDLTLTYWIGSSNKSVAANIQTQVNQAIDDYKLWQKSKPGRDIDPSELIMRVKNAGAKRVSVTSPTYLAVDFFQVAKENLVTVTYGGLEDD